MISPTVKDVARHAKVSTATVSRVINKKTNVRPEIRTKVEQAIELLGYQPSRTAQRLRARRGFVIGVIVSDIQNPFFTAVVRGAEDVAYQHGYSLILCNTDEDPDKEHLYLDVMRAEAVAGVILAPTTEESEGVRKLVRGGIPVVVIDRQVKDDSVDSVYVDSVQGTMELMSHLLNLGHRRIGLITGPTTISTMRERHDGYVQALQQQGLPVCPELIQFGPLRASGGYACTQELLRLDLRPTAILAANNQLAFGALRAIQDAKLRIPEDISLVGFSDMPWFVSFRPPLTVLSQPDYELGQRATEMLVDRLNHPDKPATHVRLNVNLLVRASSSAPTLSAG
jgi:DNA-binding LacI/PurR family transcriptional regulator